MPTVPRVIRLLAATGLLALGIVRLGLQPGVVAADVVHVAGYQATVLGFTSWYGSYDLGELGTAWCIDHGIRAPDPDLRYADTALDGVPATTQTALAWAVGRHGTAPDRIGAAALMLVGHDLMGASYPHGPLEVDALGPDDVAGFGADGPALLERARSIKADALAHAGLQPPWQLELVADDPVAGATGTLTIRLTAAGAAVAGIEVVVEPSGASLTSPASATAGADGSATFAFVAGGGSYRLAARATVPDLDLHAFAPTLGPAQRVARPAVIEVAAALDRAPATTTTSSIVPATTTTTTTTTSTSTTTSTTTTTTTTAPVAATTATSPSPATSATTAAAATDTTAPGPPATRALPRTGGDPLSLAATGSGLVLLGTSLRRRGVTSPVGSSLRWAHELPGGHGRPTGGRSC